MVFLPTCTMSLSMPILCLLRKWPEDLKAQVSTIFTNSDTVLCTSTFEAPRSSNYKLYIFKYSYSTKRRMFGFIGPIFITTHITFPYVSRILSITNLKKKRWLFRDCCGIYSLQILWIRRTLNLKIIPCIREIYVLICVIHYNLVRHILHMLKISQFYYSIQYWVF
jgi:hypothetical protein